MGRRKVPINTRSFHTLYHSLKRVNITFMRKKVVRFTAYKTVRKPATVEFKTKSGETVRFKAIKTSKKKEVVRFRAERE